MNVRVSATVIKNAVASVEPIIFRGSLLFARIRMGAVIGPQPPPKKASEIAAMKARYLVCSLKKVFLQLRIDFETKI